MAQFVLKIEKLSNIMGPAPILEMARAYGLRPRLLLLIISHVFRESQTLSRPRGHVRSGAVDCHVYFSTGNQES